jgi:hypothetical protein
MVAVVENLNLYTNSEMYPRHYPRQFIIKRFMHVTVKLAANHIDNAINHIGKYKILLASVKTAKLSGFGDVKSSH